MTTAAIDLDTLNELFDNQNKLDDLFSSIFDEDSFISGSKSFNEHAPWGSGQSNGQDLNSNADLSFNAEDIIFVQQKRSITYSVMPVVVEIVAISYGIMYFA